MRTSWTANRIRTGLTASLLKNPCVKYTLPYGYEFWIAIDHDIEPEGDIEMKDFAGRLYAVTTCKLQGDPNGNVLEVWMRLLEWVKSSKYRWRRTHELEKAHDPLASEEDLVLDLYLPIEE